MRTRHDISIIISTYGKDDESERLKNVLNAIKDQRLEDDINYEVIIVDNGGYLNKKTLADEYPEIKNINVVKEPKIGLSNARNKGVSNALGDILVFTDDDIAPHNKWLDSLYKAHHKTKALCIGGPVILQENIESFPEWFSDYFLRFLLPPKFPKTFGIISNPYYLIGANMSFKKEAFQKYGLFNTSLGRKGSCLLSGEDTEFIIRLNKDDVYCNPDAKVFTKIKPSRLTRRFFIKRLFWQAVSDSRIIRKHGLSEFYDADEVFLSKTLFKNFYKTLRQGKHFESICMVIRFTTFNFFTIFKL